MTAADVTAALDEYEEILQHAGAPAVGLLRLGISKDRIEALEADYGFAIPDDARAVWQWHDGCEGVGRGLVPRAEFAGPGRVFANLEYSLQFAAEFVRDTTRPADWPRGPFEGHNFIALSANQFPFLIDATPGAQVLTYLGDPAVVSLDEFPVMPVADRIRWWVWAMKNGAWSLRPDGGFDADYSKYPQGADRNAI